MRRNRSNVFRDIYNQPCDANARVKLYNSSKSSLQLIQRMSLLKRLKVHYGCVNSICWNNTGELILSGSDDQHLVLTNAYNYQVLTNYKTSHKANIFSAKFLPNNGDHRIVSCSGDGIILYTDLMRKTETFNNQFTCHSGTTYEIATILSEPHSFLSCGEDGTVRWFDLRVKDKCNNARCKEDVLILSQKAITALSVNPVLSHQIAIGCSDSTVRTFDRRMLGTPATGWVDNGINSKPLCTFTVPEFEGNSCRITSLSYSPDGHDVLVSYSSDHLYLFSLKEQGSSTQLKKELTASKNKGKKQPLRSPQPVRRLRLRGDWSDTGPDARPEREGGRNSGTEIAQARPVLHTSLMQRMTDVLSRMLNDPATRAALSSAGDDSIENVIDQQSIINRTVNDNEAANADSSNNPVEINNSAGQEVASTSTESNNTVEVDAESAENEQLVANEVIADQENATHESACVNELPVPMDIEPSHSEETGSEPLPLVHSEPETQSSNEQNSNDTESPNVESNSSSSNMMENLQDRLTTMRDGFLERHGTEPAVKLTYSDKSSTSATISLGVADEVTRDGYHPESSGSEPSSSNYSAPGPSNSNSKAPNYRTTHEATNEDVYNDSDDEDLDSERREINPIETEMDEAIENVRAAQGLDSLDDHCLSDLQVKQKYMGHRNARTMIKEANFWGNDFVMSGSDCGHVFIWDRESAKLCMLLEADQHVVNCVQPHPFLPMLATSGIDYDVKLWAPVNEESNFDEKFAEDLKKRNAVMLEETKDTITVPAVFMIRMLACLNQIRRGRGRHARRSGDEEYP